MARWVDLLCGVCLRRISKDQPGDVCCKRWIRHVRVDAPPTKDEVDSLSHTTAKIKYLESLEMSEQARYYKWKSINDLHVDFEATTSEDHAARLNVSDVDWDYYESRSYNRYEEDWFF